MIEEYAVKAESPEGIVVILRRGFASKSESTHRTQSREHVSQALERVRRTAHWCFGVITQGGSRVREFGLHGSKRGAVSNDRPHRTSA